MELSKIHVWIVYGKGIATTCFGCIIQIVSHLIFAMLESHSTNTTENTLSNFNGNHRALLLLIRAVRVLTGTALIIVCVPLSFVFPMFFDSPHTPPLLVFAVLFSFPLSFLLTAQLYKNSLVQGKMIKAFLYGTAPLLLISSYAGIVWGLDWLTSRALHPASAIVATVGESRLFVKVPERCSPDIYILKYSMSGTWTFSQDKVDFICLQNFSENKDSFLISEALSKSRVEDEIYGDLRLINKVGDREIYRSSKNDRVEITAFTADDGHRVFARYMVPIENAPYIRVSRRLDDRFELTYGIQQPAGNLVQLEEIDRRIVSYTRSITHRVK